MNKWKKQLKAKLKESPEQAQSKLSWKQQFDKNQDRLKQIEGTLRLVEIDSKLKELGQ